MKNLIFLAILSLMILANAQASTNFQSISTKTTKANKASITFGNNKQSITNMLARMSGGDEVGNGGDEIRLNFIKISEKIINDSSDIQKNDNVLKALKQTINISNIFVVDELKIDGASVPMASVENKILLDRQSWNTVNGLLADKLDPRLEILRLVFTASQIVYSEENLLSIYASLPFYTSAVNGDKKSVAPWCAVKSSSDKIEKTEKTFSKSSSESVGAAKSEALKACSQENNVSECRILEVKQSGFAGFVKFKVTAQGFIYNQKSLSTAEIKAERCLELQRCSSMYELAPTGQIQAASFMQLDKEISSTCQL